jgi:integrase
MRTPKPFYRRFNDTWYVQLGKSQIPLAKGRQNEKEAYRRYYEVMAEQPMGRMPNPLPHATAAAVSDLFLEWCQKHNAGPTYEWYRRYLQDFCEHCGRMRVEELRPFHVTRWVDLHPEWKAARRCAIIAVKRAFNWAADEGLITSSPVKKMQKPSATARDRVLTPEERQQIFSNYPEGDSFREFLFALQETGARPGEIARVTAAHADLKAGIWVFHQHKTAKRQKIKKPRVIILTPAMIELTRTLVAKYPEGPLFRNKKGRPWDRNAIRCRFRRIRKKLKLGGNLVAYLYRHTFTTDALENGAGIAEVCELLGHTGTDMVMRHYQHLQERREHLRQAAMKGAGCASVPPAEKRRA